MNLPMLHVGFRFYRASHIMHGYMPDADQQVLDWDDWQKSPADEADRFDRDATPLCPRCLNEISTLDHYCPKCQFAVGQFTSNIPFVNIRFLCEPFEIMWRRLWRPHRESVSTRFLYASLIAIAGVLSGWIILLPIALVAWWRYPPRSAGECSACGYDLRESPERCPECGKDNRSDNHSPLDG